MQIHDLIQGSPEWDQFRLEHYGASEAAPMLGLSKNVRRNELLHMKKTSTAKEFSDWVQENILDYGHIVEAMARPLAEKIAGTEFYPVTCSAGPLSASCDGLTMAEDLAFEHKQWNAELAASVAAGILPDEHQPQCQQIMMVTPAERVLFVVSDGTPENFVFMFVEKDLAWAARISAGWEQFWADEAVYEPRTYTPKPPAAPILQLPALAIQIRGEVTVSNLPAFRAKAEAFIAGIKMELKTDEDFVNAEATVRFCKETEEKIELAKEAAIAQTSSIDELMRTVDHISAQLREKRLFLEKEVTRQKQAIKDASIMAAKKAFDEHVAALNEELAPLRLVFQARDFAGAAKNKRTLATLHNAVETELANGKIAIDAQAKEWRARLSWYRTAAAVHQHLFADLQQLIQKPDEDFKLVVNTRIEAARKAEEELLEAERARTLAEVELTTAQATPEGADLSPAAQALNEAEGAQRFASTHRVGRAGAVVGPPTLTLGMIASRLGFALTGEFLGRLGFEPAGKQRAAVLYHEQDFPSICAALCRHIVTLQQAQQAA
jgi:predicted phage-related endonuclease